MRLAVISDLHLGQGDASDRFKHNDSEFLKFLKNLELDFEHIILLGDIWETLTSKWSSDPKQGLRWAREAHPDLAHRFERTQYLYVHGNHDLVAASQGVPDRLLIDADGVRLLFTHGHHHDWLIRRARWFSEWTIWLGAWVERIGLSALYQIVYCLDLSLSRPRSHPLRDSFQRWAFGLAGNASADVVVTGHTHHAMRSEFDSRLFLNSGCCIGNEISYLSIDTHLNNYEVITQR